MKNFLIFGGTGGVGLQLVEQSLSQGYSVTVFGRNTEKLEIEAENLSPIKGNVLSSQEVEEAISKSNPDAVFITLGADPIDNDQTRAKGTKNIIDALTMRENKRLLSVTTMGMGNTWEMLSTQMQNFVVPTFLKNAFEDHTLQESYIENSNTDWTIIRPANLKDEPRTGTYRTGTSPDGTTSSSIAKADVADLMLKLWNDTSSYEQAIWITY